MAVHEHEINSFLMGEVRTKKAKYVQLANRLSAIVSDYQNQVDPLAYLARVSHLS